MSHTWPGTRIALLAAASPIGAQSPRTGPPGHATVVTAAEVAGSLHRADTGAVADAALRVLQIGGEYNVGISVVRRSQVHGRTPPDAIVHDEITEVYQITEVGEFG